MIDARSDKELIDATRPFAVESRTRSWWALLSTLALFAVLVAIASLSTIMAARIAASTVAGLVIVRLFIIYHDYLHGAIFRKSKIARGFFYVYGMFVLTPPGVWRESHNYHHAHTAKIIGSHVGSYMMVTPAIWAKMSASERFLYKTIRHPLTLAAGVFTIFMYGMCVSPLRRAPKKHWEASIALSAFWLVSVGLVLAAGWATWLFAYFLPLAIATSFGAYLFYAQHNFPDIHIQPRESWSYTRAALESSSYMKMSKLMAWFTGNIGYHHVHHLNQQIPFYRLPEAMAGIPELRNPATTTLMPRDIIANFRLKLWDPERREMVGYPDAEPREDAGAALV
jgi:acyl-lipid omega-6 desaturase (Delta-12 desaturase)